VAVLLDRMPPRELSGPRYAVAGDLERALGQWLT
jgi:hypothetical protein